MRCASGIWPPSKPRRKPSLRAFCPFCPRPDVLPRPEPVPRPIRSGRRCAPFEGLRSCSCTLFASLVLLVRTGAPDLVLAALGPDVGGAFDGHEEVDRFEHSADRWVVGELAGLVHAAEAKRLDRRLDLGLGSDGALHQSGFDGALPLCCGFLVGRGHFASTGVASAPL